MIHLPLHRRDGTIRAYALIDDEDARLAEHSWSFHAQGGYAFRRPRSEENREERQITLHREIMGLRKGDGLTVDHINGDGLDCRRENMRVVTHAQNMQNIERGRGALRGAHRHGNRWMARVKVDGKTIRVCGFLTAESAAKAARELRAIHMPYAVEERHDSLAS